MNQNIASGISGIDSERRTQIISIEDLYPQLRKRQYYFTVVPGDIMYMHNGIKYYYVEIQCDGKNFLINAYGSMAVRLFKAVHSTNQ